MLHASSSSFIRGADRFRAGVLRIVLALLLTALLAPRASAQGTMGMLPGPISTRELDGYAKRLALSPQQRRSLDALHDQYKQEFRALREGEIAQFLKEMREMDGGVMPKRKAIEDFLGKMDALSRKIAGLDNRFLDQLQTSLTEEQLNMMPRVRMARQRGRMDNMQMIWMGGQRPSDVSEIAYALDLSAPDRAAADPFLAQYEARLTSEMEKMYDNTHKMILGMYDALEKLGISEDAAQDPAQAEKIGQAMQQVWMDLMAKGQEQMAEMTTLGDQAERNITAAISPDAARSFRNQYFRQIYPEAAFALYPNDYVFAPALKRDDLTPEQREAVTAARDDMQRKLDAILDQVIAGIKEWRKSMSPFDYDQEKAEQYQKHQNELRVKADAARTDANAALEAALGKDLLDRVGRLKSSAEEPQDGMIVSGGGGMVTTSQTIEFAEGENNDETDFAWGADQFLPPGISETELAELSERLTLSEEQRTLVRDLHQRYTEAFQQLNETDLAKLQKAVAAMWQYDEQTQTSRGPTADSINETYRLRTIALESINKTDASFFDELELAVLTPEQVSALPRARQARERVVYNRGGYMWGSDSNEGAIDLARLIMRLRTLIPADQRAAVDELMAKYEQDLLPLFKKRYAKSLEAQKVQELWSAEMTRSQAEGDGNAVAMGMKYQQMMKEPQTGLAEANEAVGVLNRETISALVAMLPSDAANELRANYNRRAFPSVYNDTGAVSRHIDRARSLHDLNQEQTQQLGELAMNYLPAYAALCDELVKSSEGGNRNPYMATVDADNIEDWQKREEALSKLRFDRSELNARAASELRTILSEDQLKAIGGLPVVEDDNNRFD